MVFITRTRLTNYVHILVTYIPAVQLCTYSGHIYSCRAIMYIFWSHIFLPCNYVHILVTYIPAVQLCTYSGHIYSCRAISLYNFFFLFRCFEMLLCLNLFRNRMGVLWIVTARALALMCINRAYVINMDNLLALTVME